MKRNERVIRARTDQAFPGHDPVVVVDKSARTFTRDSFGNLLPTPISQPAGTFYYASLYSPPGNPAPHLPCSWSAILEDLLGDPRTRRAVRATAAPSFR